ncbi:class I SAM-dependent methyltransferase [Patescibacteria group bacterium]|nr:class I SAM-dependent methyltransferase [Patescibacteria group bacterium]
MKKIILRIYDFIGKMYLSLILNFEQRKRPFPKINERSAEYGFSFKHLQKLCVGKVLDIGPGKSSWPHLLSTCGYDVKAIDKIVGYWKSYFNRHYKIINDDITNSNLKEKFQFVTCLSVLEHIPNHRLAITNIHNLLENNGYLILTFPYNETEYHENIYKHPKAGYGKDANFVTQIFSRREINDWINDTSFKIIDQEYYKIFSGELWTFGERIAPSLSVEKQDLHHLTCLLLQKTNEQL